MKPKPSRSTAARAPSGLGRLWQAVTGAPRPGPGAASRPAAPRVPDPPVAEGPPQAPASPALAQLFVAHPAARRMFPNLWRLARIWSLPGSTPLQAAEPELLRSAVRELHGLVANGQPADLHALLQSLMAALAAREHGPVSALDDDRLRSRFNHERVEVGETSMDDFVQEEMAWTKTQPSHLAKPG